MVEWTARHSLFGGVNYFTQGDGFYVSYNPDTQSGLTALFGGAGDEPEETALCHPDDGYLILNGDFRAAYENLIPQGYAACKAFYDQQSAHADSSWSGVGEKPELPPLRQ